MKSKPLASVIDMMDENDGFKSNLGIPEQGRYFNTGVILYDRRKFRELQIGKKSAEYAMRNPEKITYIDQCGFNAAAWDQFLEIGREWNLMVGFHQGQLAKTSIVHFCALKPWENKGVPGLELYAHFRNKTPMPLEMNNNESAGFLEPVATFLAGLKARLHAAVSNRKTYQVELVRVRNRKLLREYWKSRYHGSD
jgi:lipopolysaccharide biosynthesis glycosyltransferase